MATGSIPQGTALKSAADLDVMVVLHGAITSKDVRLKMCCNRLGMLLVNIAPTCERMVKPSRFTIDRGRTSTSFRYPSGDHYPDVRIAYGEVTFELTRYDVGGKVTDRDVEARQENLVGIPGTFISRLTGEEAGPLFASTGTATCRGAGNALAGFSPAHHCADLEAPLDHPLPWLRYLEADELAGQGLDFAEMDVESPTGERLGEVDGFVVDSVSGRPYYIAVDSGGWFKSKHFLLPVGHAQLDRGREVIVADLARDRVERFPGFDKDLFQKFSKDELGRFNQETCRACEISGVAYTYSETEPWSAAWDRPDFLHPDWWRSTPVQPGRIGAAGVTARPETTVAREAEPSPHFGGRAQPGDVIGVETGGERTHVGETTEDENDRRRDAEDEVATGRNRRPRG